MTPGCTVCGYAVEWLRSCYANKWRLFRGRPDVLTPGRYVFAPEGTPHFPGWHNFGSKTWTTDERDPWPALGEAQSRPTWTRGETFTNWPRAIVLGDLDCLQSGERTPLPLVNPPELVGGFDVRCFPPADQVDVIELVDTSSRAFQIFSALVLDQLYDDPAFAVNLVQAYFGPEATVSLVPNTSSTNPGTIIVITPKQTVVFISGTSNLNQAATQVLYQGLGAFNVGTYSTNLQWFAGASAVVQRINAAGADPTRPITLIGHSYGGAAACLIGAAYVQQTPDRDISLLTFGCPKPGDSRLTDILAGLRQIHYANQGDPIPAIPPVLAPLLPTNVGAAPWQLIQYPGFARPPGQVSLSITGVVGPPPDDSILTALIFQFVAEAISSSPITIPFEHGIKEYLFRLTQIP